MMYRYINLAIQCHPKSYENYLWHAGIPGLAYEEKISSLKKSLSYAFNDDARARIYIQLGLSGYTDDKHSTGESWYLEALEFANNSSPKLQAKIWLVLGNTKPLTRLEEIRICYFNSLKLLGPEGSKDLRASGLSGLANLALFEQNFKEALAYFREAQILAPQNKKIQKKIEECEMHLAQWIEQNLSDKLRIE